MHHVEPRDDELAWELTGEDEELAQVPITGIERIRPSTNRRPVPDSRSSGSE